jgi:hypothetical protein
MVRRCGKHSVKRHECTGYGCAWLKDEELFKLAGVCRARCDGNFVTLAVSLGTAPERR